MQETHEIQAPSLGREDASGVGKGNLLQYSCLENPTDTGAWWATGYGVTQGWTEVTLYTRTKMIISRGPRDRRGHRNGCLQATGSELAIPKPMSLDYLFRIKHAGTKTNAPVQV